MRAIYFLAGLLLGLYVWGYLTERLFPDPCTETATDGRIWRWQLTSPAT